MRVYVYYNLHRKLWSVKALEGPRKGLVIGHRHHVLLRSVTPRVSQAGRARVLRTKRKNVHAGLVGQWCETLGQAVATWDQITYNPYKYTSFVDIASGDEYKGSQWAYLSDKRVYVL